MSSALRSVEIAGSVGLLLDHMSEQMHVSREAIVHQAIYQYARLHGFVDPPVIDPTTGRVVVPGQTRRGPAAGVALGEQEDGRKKTITIPRMVTLAKDVDRIAATASHRVAEPSGEGELNESSGELRDVSSDSFPRFPVDDGDDASEPPVAEHAAADSDGEPNKQSDGSQDNGEGVAEATEGDEERSSSAGSHASPDHDEPDDEQPDSQLKNNRVEHTAVGPRPIMYVSVEGEEPVKVDSDRCVLGRGPKCTIIIDSRGVSREHAILLRQDGGIILQDLDSANGTWFEGERIERRRVNPGDVFVLGNRQIQVDFDSTE